MLFDISGLENWQKIPPPSKTAIFPDKVQFKMIGKQELVHAIPPPYRPAVFPAIVQFVMTGSEYL